MCTHNDGLQVPDTRRDSTDPTDHKTIIKDAARKNRGLVLKQNEQC